MAHHIISLPEFTLIHDDRGAIYIPGGFPPHLNIPSEYVRLHETTQFYTNQPRDTLPSSGTTSAARLH